MAGTESAFQTLIDGARAVEGEQSLEFGDAESSPAKLQGSFITAKTSTNSDAGRRTTGAGPGRKPRACLECKKQKMRCELLPGEKSCRNCLRRKHQCVMKRNRIMDSAVPAESAQTYTEKIDAMRAEIQCMRASLEAVLQAGQTGKAAATPAVEHLMRLAPAKETTETPHSHATDTVLSRDDNIHMAMTRENSPALNGDHAHNGAVTVEEPMNSLFEVTRLRNIRSNHSKRMRPAPESRDELNDFISRGVITEGEAEELYNAFHMSLNHYLWVGLEQTHPSFISVRKSSELLTATILTVTALHMPASGATFDVCYKEFLSLISSSMFSRYHSIDDVRGLVIAAFWLSEVSWKLSGHAIRIATELDLHGSFIRALEGDREHFLRARLWYMLYVCDHHFSIAYGRPPMIAESQQIREHDRFLASPLADALDARILSQVNLMQILTRIWDRFGERGKLPPLQQDHGAGSGVFHGASYPHRERSSESSGGGAMLNETDSDFADLRSFNLEIDAWRMKWVPRQQNNRFIGTFPPKGIVLYSYFAKLQLNSLAIRGVSLSLPSGAFERAQPQGLSTERKEFANMAISAAASILTFVLEEDDMRRALVGTPLYVHTMIAFASVFLMKVATKWNRVMGLNVEARYVSRLLERVIDLLKSSVTSDRHLVHHLAAGLEKMSLKLGLRSVSALHSGQEMESERQGPAQPEMGTFAPMHSASSHGEDMSTTNPEWGTFVGEEGNAAAFGEMPIMNDNFIFEAFGSDSSNDVYNMLTSQFSY